MQNAFRRKLIFQFHLLPRPFSHKIAPQMKALDWENRKITLTTHIKEKYGAISSRISMPVNLLRCSSSRSFFDILVSVGLLMLAMTISFFSFLVSMSRAQWAVHFVRLLSSKRRGTKESLKIQKGPEILLRSKNVASQQSPSLPPSIEV